MWEAPRPSLSALCVPPSRPPLAPSRCMQPGAVVCPGDVLFPAVRRRVGPRWRPRRGLARCRSPAAPAIDDAFHPLPQSTHAPGPGTHVDGDSVVASLVGKLALLPPAEGDQVQDRGGGGGCGSVASEREDAHAHPSSLHSARPRPSSAPAPPAPRPRPATS